jgi:hypothetical protein
VLDFILLLGFQQSAFATPQERVINNTAVPNFFFTLSLQGLDFRGLVFAEKGLKGFC